jgi:hypothetical protein
MSAQLDLLGQQRFAGVAVLGALIRKSNSVPRSELFSRNEAGLVSHGCTSFARSVWLGVRRPPQVVAGRSQPETVDFPYTSTPDPAWKNPGLTDTEREGTNSARDSR